MDCDFIEIGTSNFGTCIPTCNDDTVGICVEPLKMYLHNLPNRPHVKKVNCAIGDEDGSIPIYFVHPKDIEKYLPGHPLLRGYNSVGVPHPGLQRVLEGNNLSHLLQKLNVPLITFGRLLAENNVRSIKFLKIDTEGYDTVILQNLLDSYREMNVEMESPLWPETIKFESNSLTESSRVDDIIDQLSGYGYQVKYRTDEDTVLVRPIRPPDVPPQVCKILVIAYDLSNDQYSLGTRIKEVIGQIQQLANDHFTFEIKTVEYKISLREASTLFRVSKPDIIVTQQFANEHGKLLSERLRIPHVCVVHNNYGEVTFCYPPSKRPHFVLVWNHENLYQEVKSKGIPSDNYSGYLGQNFIDFLFYRVSVCVPCHGRHIDHLSGMLENLGQFTVCPHEVIISISLSDEVTVTEAADIINVLQERYSSLMLRIHLSTVPLTASQNRNLAADDSTGTILLFLDADDLYHPQMIEVIQHVWRTHSLVALSWEFQRVHESDNVGFPPIDVQSVTCTPGDEIYRKFSFDEEPSFRYDKWYEFAIYNDEIVNGHLALAKVAWNTHPYPDIIHGEDTFHHRILNWNYRTLCLWARTCLSFYRQYLSAH